MSLSCFVLAIPANLSIISYNSSILSLANTTNRTLLHKLQTYMRFASAANCRATWADPPFFPVAGAFEVENPTYIVSGLIDEASTGAGYVSVNDDLKAIIVSFRGSDTRTLWIIDFQVWWRNINVLHVIPKFLLNLSIDSDLRIHSGFQDVYMALRDAIQPAIVEQVAINPTYKIVFAAHSLGAALSTIGAVDFAVHNREHEHKIEIFAFATPRVGNAAWADYVNAQPFAKKSVRIVKYGDPGI